MQMLGHLDDDLREALGVQTAPLRGADAIYGFPQTYDWKEWRTPWGQNVLVAKDFVTTTNSKGDTFIYAGGDTNYPPAACMPEGGFFFDSINRTPEFDEDNYDVRDNFEEFGPFTEAQLDWMRAEKARLEHSSDAIVGVLPGISIGDVAMVPGPMLKEPKGIRDIAEWYMATVANQDILHEIFEYQLQQALQNAKTMHDILGESIQVVFVSGTDFGTQTGQFCSSETYRELFQPYHRKINDWIHQNTTWKTFKHCCGSVFNLIPDLIEGGFDVLNPVQWTALNMSPEALKKEYGKQLIFWGGGIDTQRMLPQGTPQQVYDEALECCKVFGKGGGFVFNTIHNVQPDVPAANVDALVRAVKKYNGES